ncbi:YciI family protein [Nonomuraea cavernae]|uniref:YciI family protein n=1 Tax=Nonomuraea cavernae TaxID=2045107 RepID=UPI001CD935F8|nr:YciI family protein [Nonomuraea cavernae]MCA2184553.1 YciI family protein [Nonomuraea cavernae]
MILIYGNQVTRGIWRELPDERLVEGWRAHAAVTGEVVASGELVVSAALADASLARRVPADGGAAAAPEADERLAGILLVDCESFERAVEIGSQLPEAPYGVVEVRPVLHDGGLEM